LATPVVQIKSAFFYLTLDFWCDKNMALPSDLASYVPLNSQHGTPSHTAEIKHISAQT
jgi:hypothetical protein